MTFATFEPQLPVNYRHLTRRDCGACARGAEYRSVSRHPRPISGFFPLTLFLPPSLLPSLPPVPASGVGLSLVLYICLLLLYIFCSCANIAIELHCPLHPLHNSFLDHISTISPLLQILIHCYFTSSNFTVHRQTFHRSPSSDLLSDLELDIESLRHRLVEIGWLCTTFSWLDSQV